MRSCLIGAIGVSLVRVRGLFAAKWFVPDEYSWYELWQFGLR